MKRYAVLKDLIGNPEDPELEMAREQSAEPERVSAQFRASLRLSLAADIRRRRASQEMKGMVSC